MSADAAPAVVQANADGAEEIGRAFKRSMAAMRRLRGRETHRPGELSYAQYGLLFGLASGCELSSRELAYAAGVTAATATQMLEGLEAAGLVERSRSDHDKRVVLTSLTARGREVIAARRAEYEPLWREALSEFTDADLHTAAAVLDRLALLFEQMAES